MKYLQGKVDEVELSIKLNQSFSGPITAGVPADGIIIRRNKDGGSDSDLTASPVVVLELILKMQRGIKKNVTSGLVLKIARDGATGVSQLISKKEII